MSKKVFTTITGLVLILSLYTQSIPGNSLLSASAECIDDTMSADIVTDYETFNEDEALSTAVQLFSDYINENSTDWKKVQYENLDRDPVKSLDDYKIVNAHLVYHEATNFTVRVTYDVKYTDESDMWLAGNGNKQENNWIRNKINFINIEKNNDNYSIKNIYT